jgi:hypothetical protein
LIGKSSKITILIGKSSKITILIGKSSKITILTGKSSIAMLVYWRVGESLSGQKYLAQSCANTSWHINP